METVLDKSSKLVGRVEADGDCRVEGTLEGALHSSGKVTVALGGLVAGPLTAREVDVFGCVEGDVVAGGHVTLASTGRINGKVKAGRIRVEDGGVLQGSVLTRSRVIRTGPEREGADR